MSVKEPPLLALFRSHLQIEILLRLMTTGPGATAAEISRILGEPEPSVTREVRRLLLAGWLRGEPIGRAVRLYPNEDNPGVAPLRQLLTVTCGPSHLLATALTGVDGISEAFIHGSWAARYQGEPGTQPGDIDVIVVGEPDRASLDAVLDAVEKQVGQEINATYVTPSRWNEASDPFIAHVQSQPLVSLEIGGK